MFSIVTANWNGEKVLNVFLESFTCQTYKNFFLYIVDNGSTDRSIEIINKYSSRMNIVLIKLDENHGFAEANNIGINKAMLDKSEYIITLNNDIELEKDCLLKLKEKIHKLNNKYDIFQILLLNYFDRANMDALGITFDKYYIPEQMGYKQPYTSINEFSNDIDGVCAGAAVYSKKSLLSVKINGDEYFDSKFFAYYEDVDLALRLKQSGFKTYLVKDAIAYHFHSATGGENSYFKSYYLSRNLFLYLKKNLDHETFAKNRKIYILRLIKEIVKLLIRGRFKAVGGTIKGYLDFRQLQVRSKVVN